MGGSREPVSATFCLRKCGGSLADGRDLETVTDLGANVEINAAAQRAATAAPAPVDAKWVTGETATVVEMTTTTTLNAP